MECYKEFPRSIGLLTCLSGLIHLLAGMALMLGLSIWLAALFGLIHIALHLYWYPRQACVHCCYYNRYCISLKGRYAGRVFRRGNETLFYGGMKRAMRGIYLFWVFPFVVLIIAQLRGRPILAGDLLLAGTLILLMVMRQLMRKSLGCRVCLMREPCPMAGPDPRRPVEVRAEAPAGPGS